MRRFYLDRHVIRTGRPVITGADARHVRTVLRSRPGDELIVFDGHGVDYRTQILNMTGEGVHLRVLSQFPSANESPVQITIGQALIKNRKMDRIVRHFTELGGSTFIAFPSERSMVKRETDRFRHRITRWEKIARESLKQCGRPTFPDIRFADSFETILNTENRYDLRMIFDNTDQHVSPEHFLESNAPVKRVLALVGPEGGFTPNEVEGAIRRGLVPCHMGPRILKSDTAAIVALTIIQHRFGDLANPKRA